MMNVGEKQGVMKRVVMRNRGSDDEWRGAAGSDEHLRETWGAMRNGANIEEWRE